MLAWLSRLVVFELDVLPVDAFLGLLGLLQLEIKVPTTYYLSKKKKGKNENEDLW